MSMTMLVLGTHNQKKLTELQSLLSDHAIQVSSLAAYTQAIQVEETGETYADNAILKASEQAKVLNEWVLGEDSGLSVDYLDGAPGVYSARFSGPGATDDKNNQTLLSKLEGVARNKRTAHYVCHLALSNPMGEIVFETEQYCHGLIRQAAVGTGGFGYDPLFEVVEYGKTFGEMGAEVKSVLSHRSRAMSQFRRFLQSSASLTDATTT